MHGRKQEEPSWLVPPCRSRQGEQVRVVCHGEEQASVQRRGGAHPPGVANEVSREPYRRTVFGVTGRGHGRRLRSKKPTRRVYRSGSPDPDLELAPIGWQLFALDNAQSYWAAPLLLLGTYDTRLLAQPLR